MKPAARPASQPATPRSPHGLSRRATRAAVMIETVLALPILLIFLVLLMHFGVMAVHLQQATVASRHEAWRQAEDVSVGYIGPTGSTVALNPAPPSSDTPDLTNRYFLDGAADEVVQTHVPRPLRHPWSQRTIDAFVDRAPGGATLLELLLHVDAGTLQTITAADFTSTGYRSFGNTRVNDQMIEEGQSPYLRDRVGGIIEAQHVRHRHDWRFVNGYRRNVLTDDILRGSGYATTRWSTDHYFRATSNGRVPLDLFGQPIVYRDDRIEAWSAGGPGIEVQSFVRDAYLLDFDDRLRDTAVRHPGSIAAAARAMYLRTPEYVGPMVYRP